MSDPLLQDLMDRVRNRFYGKYRGVVTDVDAGDDAHQGVGALGAASRDRHRMVHAMRSLRGAAGGVRHAARGRQRRVDRV